LTTLASAVLMMWPRASKLIVSCHVWSRPLQMWFVIRKL